MDLTQIQKRITLLEKYSKEIKDAKEMLKEELENNSEYLEACEAADEANAKKKRIKQEVLGVGPNEKLAREIKSNNEEVTTLKEILSAELFEVYKENNTDEIADESGESRKFKITAKLLPKGYREQKRDFAGKYTDERE